MSSLEKPMIPARAPFSRSPHRRWHAVPSALLAGSLLAALVAADAPRAGEAAPPAAATGVCSEVASPSDPDTPSKLLADLERTTDTLRDFSARIVYENLDSLTEEAELRYGRVVYQRPPEARHRMAILLDEYVDGGGRKESIDQRYVFVDGWVADIDAARRQFIKRQIASPDSDHDPLRIGQGPFPLPIGQRRDDVEARFEVVAAPAPVGRLAEGVAPASLRSLRLVPRAGMSEAEEFRTIDLHYSRETLLPVLVVAQGTDGSRRTVRLLRPLRNAGLSEEDLALLAIETPDPSLWTIDIRPWRASE